MSCTALLLVASIGLANGFAQESSELRHHDEMSPQEVVQVDTSGCPGADDALRRAVCLKELAFSLFDEFAGQSFGYDASDPRFVEAQAIVDESASLLESVGETRELAHLLIETAETIPHVFITNDVTPQQMQVQTVRERYLQRSIELFRAIGDYAWELRALRESVDRADPAQLKRTIALAVWVEGAESVSLTHDIELLAGWYFSRDIRECIRLTRWIVDIYRLDSSRRAELADTLYTLGWDYFRAGELADARHCYDEAIQLYDELDSDDTVAQMARYAGAIALELDELDEADAYYSLALSRARSPRDFAEARLGLALLRYREGNRHAAIDMLTNPPESFWAVIVTDFYRFFTVSEAIELREPTMALFDAAGIPDAVAAIRGYWPDSNP